MSEKRLDSVVSSAVEGAGLFYAVKTEPIPSKTCFDVVLKTYSQPSKDYPVTVHIPKTYPFDPPALTCPTEKKLSFPFLQKNQWKPTISMREVLIEACHVISRRDLSTRQPKLPNLKPPMDKKAISPASKSPKKDR